MFKKIKLVALLSFLVVGGLAYAPVATYADDSVSANDDCAQSNVADRTGNSGPAVRGRFSQMLVQNLTRAAGQKGEAFTAGMNSVPRLDLNLAYCLDNIDRAFSFIIGLADASSLFGMLADILWRQVVDQITAACNQTAASLMSLGQSISPASAICIPKPSIDLGLEGLKIKIKQRPCNGISVPLLQQTAAPTTATGGTATPPTTYNSLWGLGAR